MLKNSNRFTDTEVDGVASSSTNARSNADHTEASCHLLNASLTVCASACLQGRETTAGAISTSRGEGRPGCSHYHRSARGKRPRERALGPRPMRECGARSDAGARGPPSQRAPPDRAGLTVSSARPTLECLPAGPKRRSPCSQRLASGGVAPVPARRCQRCGRVASLPPQGDCVAPGRRLLVGPFPEGQSPLCCLRVSLAPAASPGLPGPSLGASRGGRRYRQLRPANWVVVGSRVVRPPGLCPLQ